MSATQSQAGRLSEDEDLSVKVLQVRESEKDVVSINDSPTPYPPGNEQSRALVRLWQCQQCSKLLQLPVTLPCGYSLCRSCVPALHERRGVSYPDLPGRQQGFNCPNPTCKDEHVVDECNLDVILTKIIELVQVEVQKELSIAKSEPVKVSVRPQKLHKLDNEKSPSDPAQYELEGGYITALLIMAENGNLDFTAEVDWEPESAYAHTHKDLDAQMWSSLQSTVASELDCHVCYHIMLDPVTTPCGHTFCRRCLARILDHSNNCPFCRRRFDLPLSLIRQPGNSRLLSTLDLLCAAAVQTRKDTISQEENFSGMGNGKSVPLFLCTLAFPGMPTYLHVFEPRYRLMIRRALDTSRQFGMLMYNVRGTPQGELGASPFMEFGTMLEIVECQMLDDGRSFLETRGLYRFKVKSHRQVDGYTIGDVERVEDIAVAEEERLEAEETSAARLEIDSLPTTETIPQDLQLRRLSTRDLLLQGVMFIQRMQAISAPWLQSRIITAYGGAPDDPVLFPFWFASVLPISEAEKYFLLHSLSVRARLKIVNRWIQRIEGQRWYVRSLQRAMHSVAPSQESNSTDDQVEGTS